MAPPVAPVRPSLDRVRQQLDSLAGLEPEAAPELSPPLDRVRQRLDQLLMARHAAVGEMAEPQYQNVRGVFYPANEAAQDIATAEPIRAGRIGGPVYHPSPRTAAVGGALGALELIRGIPGFVRGGLEAVGSGFTGPAYREEMARQAVARAAAGQPPEPSAGATFLQGLNPFPTLERAGFGDPEAFGQSAMLAYGLRDLVPGRTPAAAAPPQLGRGPEPARPRLGAPRPEPPRPAPGTDPFADLGLDRTTATVEDVQRAYVEAAQRTHPDVPAEERVRRGGSADQLQTSLDFLRANEAKEAALRELGAKPSARAERAARQAEQARAEREIRAEEDRRRAAARQAATAQPRQPAQPPPERPAPAPAPAPATPEPVPVPERPQPAPRPQTPPQAVVPAPRVETPISPRGLPPGPTHPELSQTPPYEQSFAARQERERVPPTPTPEEFLRRETGGAARVPPEPTPEVVAPPPARIETTADRLRQAEEQAAPAPGQQVTRGEREAELNKQVGPLATHLLQIIERRPGLTIPEIVRSYRRTPRGRGPATTEPRDAIGRLVEAGLVERSYDPEGNPRYRASAAPAPAARPTVPAVPPVPVVPVEATEAPAPEPLRTEPQEPAGGRKPKRGRGPHPEAVPESNPKYAKMSNADLEARWLELVDRIDAAQQVAGKGIMGWARRKTGGGDSGSEGVVSGTAVTGKAGRAIGTVKTAGRLMGEVEQELQRRGVTIDDLYERTEERRGMQTGEPKRQAYGAVPLPSMPGVNLRLEEPASLQRLLDRARAALAESPQWPAEMQPYAEKVRRDVAALQAELGRRGQVGEPQPPTAEPESVADVPAPRLSALHNLSAENLTAADRLGGLPAPSLAIVPEQQGLEGYGPITLIGKRELADPTQTPIYPSDAYTGRNPPPEYPKVRSAVAQRFVDRLRPGTEIYDERHVVSQVWDELVNRATGPRPAEVQSLLRRSLAARALYLAEQGIAAKPRMRATPLRYPLSRAPALRDFFAERGVDHGARPGDEYWRALSAAAREAVEQHLVQEYKDPEHRAIARHGAMENMFEEGPEPELHFAHGDRIMDDQARIGTREVDRGRTEKVLKKATPSETGFHDWLDEQVKPLLGTPSVRLGRRKVPYTLENVAAATDVVPGKEGGMTFGPGAARAAMARRIPDLAWLRNAVEAGVRPKAEVEAARKLFEDAQDEWRTAIVQYYRPDAYRGGAFGQVWEGLDAVHRAIGRWGAAAMKRGRTATALRRELEREGFQDVPAELVDDGVTIASAIMDMPVSYFEGKPPRPVHFDEFAGAVIPEDAPPAVTDILRRRGIPFRTYTGGPEQQVAATRAFRQELHQGGAHTLLEPKPYAGIEANLGQHTAITFGSAEQGKAATLEVVREAGRMAQLELFGEPRPVPLDPVAREAAVARAAEPKAWVMIKGQNPQTPQELHGLMWPFRSPATERFHFALRGSDGTVLEHQMHSSGAINAVKIREDFADVLIARMKEIGAPEAELIHNHPSGNPTVSDDDIAITGYVGKRLTDEGLRLRGHLVTDDITGTYIKHLGDQFELHPVTVPREPDPQDWTATHGPEAKAGGIAYSGERYIRSEDVADLIVATSGILPEGRFDVLYMNGQAVSIALEPHTTAALKDIDRWLPERIAALAADHVYVVVGPGEVLHRATTVLRGVRGVNDVFQVAQDAATQRPRWLSAYEQGAFRPVPEAKPAIAHQVFEPSTPYGPPNVPPETGPIGSAGEELDKDLPLPEAAGLEGRGAPLSVTRVVEALRAVFNPESFGEVAKATAGTIRAGRARGAMELTRAQESLRALSKAVGRLTKRQAAQLWDDVEHWGAPGTRLRTQRLGIPPGAIDAFHALTAQYSAVLEDLGILEPTIAHYVGRYWKGTPKQQQSFLARVFGRRPLEGPKTFAKHRTFDAFADGLRAGLVPLTYNFVDSQLLKFAEMQRAIDGRRMVLEELRAGRAKKVMLGQEPPTDATGEWVRVGDGRDPAFTIYGPREMTVEGEKIPVFGRRIMGHFYAPPQSAAIWNNALSRGLRGHAIYDALMAPGQAAAQMILGLSGFHGTVIAQEAMFSEAALGRLPQAGVVAVRGPILGRRIMEEYERRGTHPELARVLDAMIQGGFRSTRRSELWAGDRRARFKAALRDALHGESLGRRLSGAVRVPFDAVWAAIEGASFPTMGFYVPHQKAFATYIAAERALRKLPAGTPIEEVRRVMGDIVKEMDYRFGQVQYENHFINNVAKDLAQFVFLAPGWTGGTLVLAARGVRQAGRLARQAVGGAKNLPPIGTSSLRYWLAAFAGLAIFNGLLTYLLTGEWPEGKDFLAFRDGTKDRSGNENRYRLPGYIMHDLYAWSHHPWQTLGNKLSPGLHWAYALGTNRTYYGDQVYDPTADWSTVLEQIAAFTAKSNEPISLQNIAEARRRGETGVLGTLPGFAGISPAPREFVATPAQNLMAEFSRRQRGQRTPEEVEMGDQRYRVTEAFRNGDIDYQEAQRQLQALGLRSGQVADALRKMQEPPLMTRFKALSLEQAEQVYALGTPEEQRLWISTLSRKRTGGGGGRSAPRAPRMAAPRMRP